LPQQVEREQGLVRFAAAVGGGLGQPDGEHQPLELRLVLNVDDRLVFELDHPRLALGLLGDGRDFLGRGAQLGHELLDLFERGHGTTPRAAAK
jgi:hypothetical protein